MEHQPIRRVPASRHKRGAAAHDGRTSPRLIVHPPPYPPPNL